MNAMRTVALATVTSLVLASSALAAEHQVSIEGFKFMPASLTVAVGDTVTFTNNDGAPHTASGNAFDTGTLQKGESSTVTIDAAGNHAYKCNFHASMSGSISAE